MMHLHSLPASGRKTTGRRAMTHTLVCAGAVLLTLGLHTIADRDFAMVTRGQQNNDTQYWRITALGGGIHTIQQVSSGRFADAHEIAEKDFNMVTRPQQGDSSQQWRIVFLQ